MSRIAKKKKGSVLECLNRPTSPIECTPSASASIESANGVFLSHRVRKPPGYIHYRVLILVRNSDRIKYIEVKWAWQCTPGGAGGPLGSLFLTGRHTRQTHERQVGRFPSVWGSCDTLRLLYGRLQVSLKRHIICARPCWTLNAQKAFGCSSPRAAKAACPHLGEN